MTSSVRAPITRPSFGNVAADRWAQQIETALRAIEKKSGGGTTTAVYASAGAVTSGVEGEAEAPTQPMGLTVVGAYSTITLRWTMPTYIGHAVTEIYRSTEDDFGSAEKVFETAIGIWADAPGPGVTYFYWIRFRNINSVQGPLNATAGTEGKTAENIDVLLGLLEGQLSDIYFTPWMLEQFEYLTELELLNVGGLLADIVGDIENIGLDNLALLAELGKAEIKAAQVEFVSDKGHALAQTVKFALADEVEARAGEVTRIEAKFDGSTAAINQSLLVNTNAISATAQSITLINTSIGDITANYASKVYVSSTIDSASVEILEAAQVSFGDALGSYATKVELEASAESVETSVITTIDARFDENSGTYGLQIKSAVDAANAATTKAENLAAGIYDENGNLSQAFIDNVSLVAVEADGATIAGAISAYTANANGHLVSLQQIAEAGIDTAGNTFSSRWGIKSNVNGLVGGIGFLNDGVKTSFTVNSDLFAVINSRTGQVKPLLTAITNDPVIPDGVYIDAAFIKVATIAELVAGAINADTVTAGIEIVSPAITGGVFTGGSYIAQSGSYKTEMVPSSTLPIWYGLSSLSKTIPNANFAVDRSGRVHAKGLQVRNLANDIIMDVNGFNGTYIQDLTVGTLAIGENAVTVPLYIETTPVISTGAYATIVDITQYQGTSGFVYVSLSVLTERLGDESSKYDTVTLLLEFYQGATLVRSLLFDDLDADQDGGVVGRHILPIAGAAQISGDTFRVRLLGKPKNSPTQDFRFSVRGYATSAKR